MCLDASMWFVLMLGGTYARDTRCSCIVRLLLFHSSTHASTVDKGHNTVCTIWYRLGAVLLLFFMNSNGLYASMRSFPSCPYLSCNVPFCIVLLFYCTHGISKHFPLCMDTMYAPLLLIAAQSFKLSKLPRINDATLSHVFPAFSKLVIGHVRTKV